MLSEKLLQATFNPTMLEFVPKDTLRAIYNLRDTSIGVPVNPPFPPKLVDLLDSANRSELKAEDLTADLELLAMKRGAIRRQLLTEERQRQAEGKASVLSRLTAEQRKLDEQIEVLSAQVTIACEDAIGAKLRVRHLLPGLWREWHLDLATAVVHLNNRVRQQRNEMIEVLYALRNTISQLALIDSRLAPLSEHTQSGLTVRNVARNARETYNDAFTTTVFHLERLAFDLPERTQPAQWLNWALRAALPDDESARDLEAPSRA